MNAALLPGQGRHVAHQGRPAYVLVLEQRAMRFRRPELFILGRLAIAHAEPTKLERNTIARRPVFQYHATHGSSFHARTRSEAHESATQQGRNPEELVQEVVAQYFDEESRFIQAVNRGQEALRRGEISRMSKWPAS